MISCAILSNLRSDENGDSFAVAAILPTMEEMRETQNCTRTIDRILKSHSDKSCAVSRDNRDISRSSEVIVHFHSRQDLIPGTLTWSGR